MGFLILIALWAFCFQFHVGFMQSQCLEDQQSLLIQLKGNLTFNSTLSTKLVSWNSSTDCCAWGGVTCSGDGYVIGLDLSNLSNTGVSGQIPVEISGLTSLMSLNLSSSGLQLNLSMLVRNLTRLTELDLSGNDLSAEGGGWCEALSSLTRLRVLNLANCGVSGPIDSSLAKLSALFVITLSENPNISGPVPEYLGNFSDLTSLDLSSCGLYGKFPEKIFHLPHLQSLDVSFNDGLYGLIPEFPENASLQTMSLRFTSFGGNLPESIGNLERLSSIDLSYCKFSGSIPDTMANLTELFNLDFTSNDFLGPMPSFSSAKNLTYLALSDNHLSGSILSTNWTRLSELKYVNLSSNSLQGAIPASLFRIPSLALMMLSQNQFSKVLNESSSTLSSTALILLDLSDNRLEGPFPAPIFQLRNLTFLDLRNNKLTGPFPEMVFQLKSLSFLRLSSNHLSGPLNLSPFQQLPFLYEINLSDNSLALNESEPDNLFFPFLSTLWLSSCNVTRFPAFLKEQPYLSHLDLSNNQIGGVVPDWLWTMSGLDILELSHNLLSDLQTAPTGRLLSYLDLSNNRLQGELLTKIRNVKYVALSNNFIQGSIPQSICNVSLGLLDLSNNSLNGAIPQCLFGLPSLNVLNLRGNNLSGNISDTFPSDCGSLQTLDLNGNQLEGKIPRSLDSCKSLEVLDLGNNKINDVFPCHLKNISSLRVLVLRSNNFHGPIGCQNNNSSWPMLQIVDLASNNFRGEVPAQFMRTWKAMINGKDELQSIRFNLLNSVYYQNAISVTMKGIEVEMVRILTVFTSIDFSRNKLEGVIPEVMGEFKALHILNMSHNAFSGEIQKSFGDLRRLESMDLSSNQLTGTIPQELADLNFLAVLNLSNNQLVGRIPTSSQFQTFSNASFQANDGLCGVPLTKSCGDDRKQCDVHSEESCRVDHSDDGSLIDWNFLSVGLGIVFGLAIVILPLMFWRNWRIWYFRHVDALLSRFLPCLSRRSRTSRRIGARTQLKEKNKMEGEVAPQPKVSRNLRNGRRVIVV